mgnify:CR=1 FL=1
MRSSYFGYDVGGMRAAMADLLGADENGNGEKVSAKTLEVHMLPNSRYPARTRSHSLIAYRMFG